MLGSRLKIGQTQLRPNLVSVKISPKLSFRSKKIDNLIFGQKTLELNFGQRSRPTGPTTALSLFKIDSQKALSLALQMKSASIRGDGNLGDPESVDIAK